MRTKLLLIVCCFALNFVPVTSRVHIRHVGPRQERTEEQKREDYSFGLLITLVMVPLIIYSIRKKNQRNKY